LARRTARQRLTAFDAQPGFGHGLRGRRIVEEVGEQALAHRGVEPLARLMRSALVERAARTRRREAFVDRAPQCVEAPAQDRRADDHRRRRRVGTVQHAQGEFALLGRAFGRGREIAVGLVYEHAVGQFHDAALDALQFVARCR
jgi:hypothetical protein